MAKEKVTTQRNKYQKIEKLDLRKFSKSLRRIIRAQRSVSLLIPHAPLHRWIKYLLENQKCSKDSKIILHRALEEYILDYLQDALESHIHAKRLTLQPQDLYFVGRLRNMPYHLDTGIISSKE